MNHALKNQNEGDWIVGRHHCIAPRGLCIIPAKAAPVFLPSFDCLLAGSALSFYYGLAVLGFILGGMVVIGGAILSTTLWCLGLWWYRLILGQAPAE